MLARILGRAPWDLADAAPVVGGMLERLRRAREPLILAGVGLLYFVGAALEPASRIRDWLAGGLWQVLFALAVAAFVIAVVDDRRLRRRLRAQAVEREQIEPAAGLVLEK